VADADLSVVLFLVLGEEPESYSDVVERENFFNIVGCGQEFLKVYFSIAV